MGSRIAVLRDGVLQQLGPPQEVYASPSNVFVGGFIGSPAMNFFDARISGEGGLWLETETLRIAVPPDRRESVAPHVGNDVIFGIRPENISDPQFSAGGAQNETTIAATVDVMEPLGSEVILYMLAGSDSFVARVDPRTTAQANQPFKLAFEMDRMHLFDRATQEAIT